VPDSFVIPASRVTEARQNARTNTQRQTGKKRVGHIASAILKSFVNTSVGIVIVNG
jgi:hypothetical protein